MTHHILRLTRNPFHKPPIRVYNLCEQTRTRRVHASTPTLIGDSTMADPKPQDQNQNPHTPRREGGRDQDDAGNKQPPRPGDDQPASKRPGER